MSELTHVFHDCEQAVCNCMLYEREGIASVVVNHEVGSSSNGRIRTPAVPQQTLHVLSNCGATAAFGKMAECLRCQGHAPRPTVEELLLLSIAFKG